MYVPSCKTVKNVYSKISSAGENILTEPFNYQKPKKETIDSIFDFLGRNCKQTFII